VPKKCRSWWNRQRGSIPRWAEELDVAKVGAAYAWVAEDVERLCDELDALDEEDD